MLPLLIALLLVHTGVRAAPAWIEHASRPGPDLAPLGRSRFDELFLVRDGEYAIPYPLEALVDFLEARAYNGANSPLRRIFIPMGRSLQRDSPAPDYFSQPREILAVEGEPVDAVAVLEYRLFIAHQPASETLEIISYNDEAGRFEFQIVDDYANGKRPRPRPANRAMCLSCHQNAGPIFSRRPWSETSFNVAVAARLAEALPDRFESPIDLASLDADVIDLMTERANYLAAAQFLWRRGCDTAACRAAVLRAVLQYRLSGNAYLDSADKRYRDEYVAELARNWARKWPQGLALAAGRIPDRDPFQANGGGGHDPLLTRPPQATWREANPVLADGIVYRLAGFFTLDDTRRIDRGLANSSRERGLRLERLRVECRGENSKPGVTRFDCGGRDGENGLAVRLRVEQGDDPVSRPGIAGLEISDSPNILQPDVLSTTRRAGELEIAIGIAAQGLSQRFANGDRIESMRLLAGDPEKPSAVLEIAISRESGLIDELVDELLARQSRGEASALGDGVFSRQALLRELMPGLGMRAPRMAAVYAAPRPKNPPVRRAPRAELALLEPYCAHCHGEATRNPPGFLAPGAGRDDILRCAPRMLARLRAWRNVEDGILAPMPPPASLPISGANPASWPSSPHYLSLVETLEKLLAAEAPEIDMAANYPDLPACLR